MDGDDADDAGAEAGMSSTLQLLYAEALNYAQECKQQADEADVAASTAAREHSSQGTSTSYEEPCAVGCTCLIFRVKGLHFLR